MSHGGAKPSAWVRRFATLVPPGANVLDLACGSGRHVRLFLARGCAVTALDRDVSKLGEPPGHLEIIEADLERGAPWPLGERRFDAVVVTSYLWRPALPRIVGAVARHGVLLYETFLAGQEQLGHPRNSEFLLRPGELLTLVGDELIVVAFEQGRWQAASGTPRMVQRICATRDPHPGRLPGFSEV